jgi:hypothetical protein
MDVLKSAKKIDRLDDVLRQAIIDTEAIEIQIEARTKFFLV